MTHSCTVRAQCARIIGLLGQNVFVKSFAIRKNLVDVAGIEPATPCLQRRERKSISLVRLVLFCVVVPGFGRNLAAFGPKLDPNFCLISSTDFLSRPNW